MKYCCALSFPPGSTNNFYDKELLVSVKFPQAVTPLLKAGLLLIASLTWLHYIVIQFLFM